MFRLFAFVRRPVVLLSGVLIFLVLFMGTYLYTSSYVEGAAFHDWLERSTSHGLHLEAHYGQLHHVGIFGLETPTFEGENGFRSIQSLTLQNITGYFSPAGILAGRWDVDNIVVEQGEVRLQKVAPVPSNPAVPGSPAPALPSPTNGATPVPPDVTNSTLPPAEALPPDTNAASTVPSPVVTNTALPVETAPVVTAPTVTNPGGGAPTALTPPVALDTNAVPPETMPTPAPEASPEPIPWYKAWLPNRVSLRHVLVKDANVIMTVRGQDAGIYDSQVVMTPNERDYEYDARDGELRVPGLPNLHVNHVHALVQKPLLTFSELLFDEGPETPDHMVRVEGSAGLKDDKTIKAICDWNHLDLAKWFPNLPIALSGLMGGHMEYQSPDLVLEHAAAHGNLHVDGVTVPPLSAVEKYSDFTGAPNPGPMPLKQAQTDLSLQNGVMTLSNLAVESEGIFRVEGTLTVTTLGHELQGDIQLGLAEPYIHWLPSAKKRIFTENRNGYWFAMVHLSGTTEKPQEDLSQRVMDEVKRDPLLALKLLFRKVTH